jgi:UDP-N-acetylmuramyl pentapeptide phosphotransferase/UDP-N-acetylglucosamine-1-phosphate transferase
MLTSIVCAAFAMLLTLAATPLCRLVSTRIGWVDEPGARKVLLVPIPRTGGIAILLGGNHVD